MSDSTLVLKTVMFRVLSGQTTHVKFKFDFKKSSQQEYAIIKVTISVYFKSLTYFLKSVLLINLVSVISIKQYSSVFPNTV